MIELPADREHPDERAPESDGIVWHTSSGSACVEVAHRARRVASPLNRYAWRSSHPVRDASPTSSSDTSTPTSGFARSSDGPLGLVPPGHRPHVLTRTALPDQSKKHRSARKARCRSSTPHLPLVPDYQEDQLQGRCTEVLANRTIAIGIGPTGLPYAA